MVLSVIAILIALASLGISFREHRIRVAERNARPKLGLRIAPYNAPPGPDGVIETHATTQHVRLAVTVTNVGERVAGKTHVSAWVPSHVDPLTYRWTDAGGGNDEAFERAAPDPSTRLDTGDGRQFDTLRLPRTISDVPLMGETLYLRVPCSVPTGGTADWPVRVRAETDGSGPADAVYVIRLRQRSDL